MSPLRPLQRHSDAVDDPDDRPARSADVLDSAARGLASVTRSVGFWLGVVLPFLHVPLLFGLGLTESTTPALVGLWGLNAVAITVGAGHEPAGTDVGSGDAEAETTGATGTDSDATATAAD